MPIQTNILKSTKENKYTYLAQATTSNASNFLPGDGTLIIPDFDSYVMFDFSQQMPDGTLLETDLSGAGQTYLIFIDDQRQVKIPALQNMSNVNKVIGQVVFKISAEQSSSIFQLSTRIFFISTAISAGSTFINETTLYSGVWQKSNEPERITYAQRLVTIKTQESAIEKRNIFLKKEIDVLKNKKRNLTEKNIQLFNIIKDLKNQIGKVSKTISAIEAKTNLASNITSNTETELGLSDKLTPSVNSDINTLSNTSNDVLDKSVTATSSEIEKNKRRKAKIIENKKNKKSNKYSSFFASLDPVGRQLNAINNVAYTLEVQDTKEKINIKRFAYIYADKTTIGKNTFIDNSWFSIKDSEGGRPSPGKVTLLVLIDKRLDEFDAKEQFKTMIGTEPIKEPPFDYNETNKSPAAYYLGGANNYYYKYIIYARDIDPNKKITEIIGEIEL